MSINRNTGAAAAPEHPAPANLAAAQTELAAARNRHRAGKAAPAKKAPAVKPAAERKAPTTSNAPKLRWQAIGGDDVKTGRATSSSGNAVYELLPGKDGWKAVLKTGGKTTMLVDGASRTGAYTAATRHHHYGQLPQPKKAAGE